MLYPYGVLNNTRYRGPIESKKILSFNNDLQKNLITLYNYFDELNNKLEEVNNILTNEQQFVNGRDLKLINSNLNEMIKENING